MEPNHGGTAQQSAKNPPYEYLGALFHSVTDKTVEKIHLNCLEQLDLEISIYK